MCAVTPWVFSMQDNLRNLVRLFWNQTFTWFSLRPSFVASCILSVTQKKSTASFQSADLGTLTRPYQWFLSVEVDGEEHTLHCMVSPGILGFKIITYSCWRCACGCWIEKSKTGLAWVQDMDIQWYIAIHQYIFLSMKFSDHVNPEVLYQCDIHSMKKLLIADTLSRALLPMKADDLEF